MDMTVVTQLYCQLYVTCQLYVSANPNFVHHQVGYNNNNNNNNKPQLGCHPVAVVILHVYKT